MIEKMLDAVVDYNKYLHSIGINEDYVDTTLRLKNEASERIRKSKKQSKKQSKRN